MPYLLRVALPDVPGSLGRVATAIGEAGGDIGAIEIVEKRHDGTAVDDVLLEMTPGAMPDSVVSACTALDDVEVIWISRYGAGGNLFLDLEVVEELTTNPEEALDRLITMLPITFRVDWAARVRRFFDGPADGHQVGSEVVTATGAAPRDIAWTETTHAARLPTGDDITLYCVAPLDTAEIVVLGRDGGPEFLDSEVARLGHLVALAASIARS